MRVATVAKLGPSPCPIIRLDTDQGVYGLGEVSRRRQRDLRAFSLEPRRGENPPQLDKVLREIKQFGGPARQGGGVRAVEMALWDIAGTVMARPSTP